MKAEHQTCLQDKDKLLSNCQGPLIAKKEPDQIKQMKAEHQTCLQDKDKLLSNCQGPLIAKEEQYQDEIINRIEQHLQSLNEKLKGTLNNENGN